MRRKTGRHGAARGHAAPAPKWSNTRDHLLGLRLEGTSSAQQQDSMATKKRSPIGTI